MTKKKAKKRGSKKKTKRATSKRTKRSTTAKRRPAKRKAGKRKRAKRGVVTDKRRARIKGRYTHHVVCPICGLAREHSHA